MKPAIESHEVPITQDHIPFHASESIYYFCVWLVAFAAGVSQTLRGGDFKSCWNSVNIGSVSGFIAFAVVSFIDGNFDDRSGDEFFYLGVAVLIGLATKQQEKILSHFVNVMLEKFGYAETQDGSTTTESGSTLAPVDRRDDCDHGPVGSFPRITNEQERARPEGHLDADG